MVIDQKPGTMSDDLEIPEPIEKIFVSVRLRPLNEKERARNSPNDWECINNDTIVFKNSLPERSMFPAAYTFDRVFGPDCPTNQVYEEGAKDIALSVLHGFNSSIFAYGQTSSGKTYTMRGITEHAVEDIYDYMERHEEREFLVKFSAMEIYNEAVRDLLSTDGTQLRLLDDPERGTVVERLTEETIRDKDHLEELLSICEAQRQIGETALNETSSRSHQILRLTIESSAREYAGAGNSSILAASVNFIDLAGSERASQTLSAGARLKEGCHINRSLLTLGTVIRKLSKGKNSHVPYRDSKLTRILQNALGGNARTAIICTMSPDRSHVEQSRNTLMFASCAKEVETNAQVNLVMSDKALVKQLQKELAKLESQMKSLCSTPVIHDAASLLREKELLIGQMAKEIKELTRQRDLAQSRLANLLFAVREVQMLKGGDYSREEFRLDGITPKFVGPDPSKGFYEVAQKMDEEFQDKADASSSNLENNERKLILGTDESSIDPMEGDWFSSKPEENQVKLDMILSMKENAVSSHMKEDLQSYVNREETYEALKQKIQELQGTIKLLARFHNKGDSPSLSDRTSSSSMTGLTKSRSCRAIITTVPSSQHNESTPPFTTIEKDFLERAKALSQNISKLKNNRRRSRTLSRSNSQNSFGSVSEGEVDNEDNYSELSFAQRPSKPFAEGGGSKTNLHSDKQIDNNLALETKDKTENSGETNGSVKLHSSWPSEFENLQRKIIELWHTCNVPLIHRTYFILLFKGDPSDSVYMEVEVRRLSFLQNTMPTGSNGSKDIPIDTTSSSAKDLIRERRGLCKQLQKKFSKKEREELYKKWGIELNTKQRSIQLARLVWTNTQDMGHVKESADLVAKLLGFVETTQAPKEVVGLNILPRTINRRSSSWKHVISPML